MTDSTHYVGTLSMHDTLLHDGIHTRQLQGILMAAAY